MIQVTRLNQRQLVLNSDLIEHIETTPDTVITLTTGTKFMVRESADEIIRLVAAFRRQAGAGWYSGAAIGGLPDRERTASRLEESSRGDEEE